jgi:hypothetical protein
MAPRICAHTCACVLEGQFSGVRVGLAVRLGIGEHVLGVGGIMISHVWQGRAWARGMQPCKQH